MSGTLPANSQLSADVAVLESPIAPVTTVERDVTSVGARTRLEAVDLLRGLVMVIMALDHTRDFFHSGALLFDPTDLTKTTPALFLTRWITHFCAPVFVFLAGTGAFLSLSRGKTKPQLSWFLLTRGVWLIFLELTVVRFGWFFELNLADFIFVQVIWALGWSMLALAALIYLPLWALAAFGVTMIAGHNLLDRVGPESFGALGWLWQVLHVQGPIEHRSGFMFLVQYPLIPWIGVMAAGYGFGRLLLFEQVRRRKILLRLGLGLTAIFVVLRLTNFYGDPQPWAVQQTPLDTLLSFLNCQKYPPSLLFLLMTLGPAIALLPLLERWTGPLARFFVTFGRVPLFYYLLHIPLLHLLAIIFAYGRYGNQVFELAANNQPPPGYGYGLVVVYLVWIGAVVLLLYPASRWFAGVKERHRRSTWLSYL